MLSPLGSENILSHLESSVHGKAGIKRGDFYVLSDTQNFMVNVDVMIKYRHVMMLSPNFMVNVDIWRKRWYVNIVSMGNPRTWEIPEHRSKWGMFHGNVWLL